MMEVIILRFLEGVFLTFFIFLEDFLVDSLATLSSPLSSSKSKAWTGLRKSSVMSMGDFLVEDGSGVEL